MWHLWQHTTKHLTKSLELAALVVGRIVKMTFIEVVSLYIYNNVLLQEILSNASTKAFELFVFTVFE